MGDRAGTDLVRLRAPRSGLARVRLRARGDWDLGVFDARGGRSVAGSAGFGGRELAEGFVLRGQRLVVQACRYAGRARSARVDVAVVPLPRAAASAGRVRVVDVVTRRRADKERLQELGLDLTEHGDRDSLQVVLHGRADAARLRRAGFSYSVRIADLRARARANRRADLRYARGRGAGAGGRRRSALPSGRVAYRRLPDFELELKALARRHPRLVRPLTLPHPTHLGRRVHGIEIARRAGAAADGKPVFLLLGAHHAREWPSAEHALEWAHDVLGRGGRAARVRRLLDRTRTIVVPVVNPDGFNISREGARPPGEPPFGLFDYEMKRKNCRPDPAFRGPCAASAAGRFLGVDPNRNYGGLWGGPGASTLKLFDTWRGPRPFSEPEVRNVRDLVASRSVTTVVSNHTYANLVLRAPGIRAQGPAPEEALYAGLGARMAARNGYRNDPAYALYDAAGGMEDWTFLTAGALSFTFEIGPSEFHPPFAAGVVGEYLGRGFVAGRGRGGNRAAYLEMLAATADPRLHSVLTGRAPRGYRLEASKEFSTATSPVYGDDAGTSIGPVQRFRDRLRSTLRAPGGAFRWAVNPSTRPVVAKSGAREAWTVVCRDRRGRRVGRRTVVVERGRRAGVGPVCG